MTGSLHARKQTAQRKTKVKTGCATCSAQSGIDLQIIRPAFTKIASSDIKLLNRYFSTKTLLDVELECRKEAEQVLQASLTNLPVCHAVGSLKALREDLETSGDAPEPDVKRTREHVYGLQQYCVALQGLASSLSSLSPDGLKSALLCCQIFINIEQVRKNYGAMAQHVIQGLGLMRECRTRRLLIDSEPAVPDHHGELPLLDVFIIKLFAGPCRFADPPVVSRTNETTQSTRPMPLDGPDIESNKLRTIAPNLRMKLTKIATTVLELLKKQSQLGSAGIARRLLSERAVLLTRLESWLGELELVESKNGASGCETLPVLFMRPFYMILRIVLLGTSESTQGLDAELQAENSRLQSMANIVGERVASYQTCKGTSKEAVE